MEHWVAGVLNGHTPCKLLPIERELHRAQMPPRRRAHAQLDPLELVCWDRVIGARTKAKLPRRGRCPRRKVDTVDDQATVEEEAKASRRLVHDRHVEPLGAAREGACDLVPHHVGQKDAHTRLMSTTDKAHAQALTNTFNPKGEGRDVGGVHETEAVWLVWWEGPSECGREGERHVAVVGRRQEQAAHVTRGRRERERADTVAIDEAAPKARGAQRRAAARQLEEIRRDTRPEARALPTRRQAGVRHGVEWDDGRPVVLQPSRVPLRGSFLGTESADRVREGVLQAGAVEVHARMGGER